MGKRKKERHGGQPEATGVGSRISTGGG
jgi:hypothetical protein